MKTVKKVLLIVLFFLPCLLKAEVKEIPFTLDDRDRIIRTEQNVESLKSEMTVRFIGVDNQFKSVDARIEAIDKRFNQLFNFLWAIIGIFTTMTVSVFAFAFWDRKLSLAPLKRDDERILAVLREYAKNQPRLTEILKNAGLL